MANEVMDWDSAYRQAGEFDGYEHDAERDQRFNNRWADVHVPKRCGGERHAVRDCECRDRLEKPPSPSNQQYEA